MPSCERCGTTLAYNDETTKLVEYACPACHATEIIWKEGHRNTGMLSPSGDTPVGAD
jgi:predicted RNA-binding Zn-ribbon protein involved in translation (DUF1610 family)